MKFHLFHLLLRHQMPDIIFRGILILCHRFVCNSTCSNANLASYALRGSKNTPLHLEIKQKTLFLNNSQLDFTKENKQSLPSEVLQHSQLLRYRQAHFLKASSAVMCCH